MSPANGEADALRADVGAVIDALYQGPREAFISERNHAARQLTAEGRREDAALVKALSKPSVSAWAVNQLWWSHRPLMQALLETSHRQAVALHSGGGPAEQTAAGRARRQALDALLRTVVEVLEAGGHATGSGTLRKISTSLEALAAHAVHGGGPQPGRMTADLAPPGFELLGGIPGPLPSPPADEAAAQSSDRATAEPTTDQARTNAESALAAAIERRDAVRARATAAAQALDRTTTEADEAILSAQRASAQLDQAQEHLEAARQAAREAERVALGAQAHARREQQRAADARAAVEGLSTELRQQNEAVQRARTRLEALA